jgi:hypothetical protein
MRPQVAAMHMPMSSTASLMRPSSVEKIKPCFMRLDVVGFEVSQCTGSSVQAGAIA